MRVDDQGHRGSFAKGCRLTGVCGGLMTARDVACGRIAMGLTANSVGQGSTAACGLAGVDWVAPPREEKKCSYLADALV